jgi:hypothetical protein
MGIAKLVLWGDSYGRNFLITIVITTIRPKKTRHPLMVGMRYKKRPQKLMEAWFCPHQLERARQKQLYFGRIKTYNLVRFYAFSLPE